uniref:Putative tick transposon n=1 Tax=Rhipicephalus microplus TaxID=6941 RepID=A0A6G5A9U4_RHIMP
MTERFNRTLGSMLSMYVASDHSNWDQVLPFVTYAYNTVVQATTGFSPYFLLYGREPSNAVDTILPYKPYESESTTLSEAARHAEECRQLARSFSTEDNYIVEPIIPSTDLRYRGRDTVHVSRLKPYYDPLVVSSP